jgi:hypothetical protein
VDIGGIHLPVSDFVNLDTLGLEVGNYYPLSFFSAERCPTLSDIKIDINFITLDPIVLTVPPDTSITLCRYSEEAVDPDVNSELGNGIASSPIDIIDDTVVPFIDTITASIDDSHPTTIVRRFTYTPSICGSIILTDTQTITINYNDDDCCVNCNEDAVGDCQIQGYCDPMTGCIEPRNKDNGSPCSDNDLCSRSDSCKDGVCMGNDPVICPSHDDCLSDSTCNPDTGVCSDQVPVDNGSPCSDNDLCSRSDSCKDGVCTGSDFITCPDSPCHIPGTCQPETGVCSDPEPVTDDTPCDDNNACTETDVCKAGFCVGEDQCCKTTKGCGLCVKNCGDQATTVVKFFGFNLEGSDAKKAVTGSVAGGWKCRNTDVCCTPKDQSHLEPSEDGKCVVDPNTPIKDKRRNVGRFF